MRPLPAGPRALYRSPRLQQEPLRPLHRTSHGLPTALTHCPGAESITKLVADTTQSETGLKPMGAMGGGAQTAPPGHGAPEGTDSPDIPAQNLPTLCPPRALGSEPAMTLGPHPAPTRSRSQQHRDPGWHRHPALPVGKGGVSGGVWSDTLWGVGISDTGTSKASASHRSLVTSLCRGTLCPHPAWPYAHLGQPAFCCWGRLPNNVS